MKKNDSYLDKVLEMQDKRFVPGYYTGGRLPPISPQKSKLASSVLYITAIVCLIPVVLVAIEIYKYRHFGLLVYAIPFLLGAILNFLFGNRYRKKKQPDKTANSKKTKKTGKR